MLSLGAFKKILLSLQLKDNNPNPGYLVRENPIVVDLISKHGRLVGRVFLITPRDIDAYDTKKRVTCDKR